MEMDFKELLFAALNMMKKVHSRGLREKAMSKPPRKRARNVQVQIMFEPSRLQENCLHQAYRYLVPVFTHQLMTNTSTRESSPQALAPPKERNLP
jgi:hypothetical protein